MNQMTQTFTKKEKELFKKNIRYLRIAYRLKQSELATALGDSIPQGYISVFESGKKEPSPFIISKYTKLFNLTEDELLRKDLSEITID